MSALSIVIATHNRAPVLRKTLQRLCELPQKAPIVVVDNASSNATPTVAGSFGDRVRTIRLERNIGAAARTAGARAVDSPLVAFCDDDCWWEPQALSLAQERFAGNERLAVVNGRVLVSDDGRLDPACEAMRNGCQSGGGVAIQYFMAGAAIVRRDAFLQAGGYHRRYHIGAEESLLSLDLAARGWELWYCDDVVLHHYPSALNRAPAHRRRLDLRNRLWTVWLRHSMLAAFRATASYARRARDPIVRGALCDALRGLPWVLRERRPISAELERKIRPVTAFAFD